MDTMQELSSLVGELVQTRGVGAVWDDALEKLRAFADAVISRSEAAPGSLPMSELANVLSRLEAAHAYVDAKDHTRALPQISGAWLQLERILERLH